MLRPAEHVGLLERDQQREGRDLFQPFPPGVIHNVDHLALAEHCPH